MSTSVLYSFNDDVEAGSDGETVESLVMQEKRSERL